MPGSSVVLAVREGGGGGCGPGCSAGNGTPNHSPPTPLGRPHPAGPSPPARQRPGSGSPLGTAEATVSERGPSPRTQGGAPAGGGSARAPEAEGSRPRGPHRDALPHSPRTRTASGSAASSKQRPPLLAPGATTPSALLGDVSPAFPPRAVIGWLAHRCPAGTALPFSPHWPGPRAPARRPLPEGLGCFGPWRCWEHITLSTAVHPSPP